LQTQPIAVKKATAGFIISLIAGIIILINGLLMFALTSVVAGIGIGAGLIDVGAAVALYGAIGLLFAIIVIVGAILIYIPGKEILGGILVLIFSIVSIIIGRFLHRLNPWHRRWRFRYR